MYHVQVDSVILLRSLAARTAICKISATPREERKAKLIRTHVTLSYTGTIAKFNPTSPAFCSLP